MSTETVFLRTFGGPNRLQLASLFDTKSTRRAVEFILEKPFGSAKALKGILIAAEEVPNQGYLLKVLLNQQTLNRLPVSDDEDGSTFTYEPLCIIRGYKMRNRFGNPLLRRIRKRPYEKV